MLGKIPLYQQLIEELVKYISDEKLLPGDQIITEPEISRKYGVSRATVRQAIQELVNAGVLVKLHGKGTFIAEPKVKMNVTTFGSFSTMAKEQGFHPSTKILCFQEIMEPTRKCDLPKPPKILGRKPGSYREDLSPTAIVPSF